MAFQNNGKHIGCAGMWNISVLVFSKELGFLELHQQILIFSETELSNQYWTSWTRISYKTIHAHYMHQASMQLKQLNDSSWAGAGAGLTPKNTLQPDLTVLGNRTSCIFTTYSSIPLLILSLCFLSTFANPSVFKRHSTPLLSRIITLCTSRLFIFHLLFGVLFK